MKRIALVGCHPDHWNKAPFGDDAWEIWGFSRHHRGQLPRVDRWFELHDPANFAAYDKEHPYYVEWMSYLGKKLVLAKDFPIDELREEFGPFFFSSGQAPWIMAYAITQKPDTIGLWGIEGDEGYGPQRHDLQHFAQVCKDRGIDIVIPSGCSLLTPARSYLEQP